MKKIQFIPAFVLAFVLVFSLLAGSVTPALAADIDLHDYLARAMGVSSSDLSNYATNYKNSLPITYEPNADSCYVALGGVTTAGSAGIAHYSTGYGDQLADKLGVDYENAATDASLAAIDAVGYITGNRLASRAIPKADLITFQLDGVAFIESSSGKVASSTPVPWEGYISDAALISDLQALHGKLVAEYAAAYGSKNAESIALVLEYMLYESIVYCQETIKATKAIRQSNSDAIILVLGLYNPLRNLSFTSNGKTIEVGAIIDDLISVCNVYLLKQTKNMNKVAFVDVSAANTNGFSNMELDMASTDLVSELSALLEATNQQYANQAGHDYIRDAVLNAAKAPCKHPQTKVINKKAATCKEAGYTGDTVCAECETVITKGSAIAKTAHNYGAWNQTKAPTCTEKGQMTRTCSNCTATETKDVAATGHKLDNGTVTKEPTCTEKGEKTYACTVCSYTEKKSVAAAGHKWNAGTVTKEPTCTETGTKAYSCTACTATKTETLAKADHTWGEGVETKKADCKTEGEMTYTCTACPATKTETIEKTTHNFSSSTVTKKPTCEESGERTGTCENCGDTATEAINPTGHNYGAYIYNGDATCQKDGTQTSTCDNCGAKDTKEAPSTRTDHVYADGVCTFCGAEEAVEADDNTVWVIVGIVAAVVVLGGGAAGFWFFKKKQAVK